MMLRVGIMRPGELGLAYAPGWGQSKGVVRGARVREVRPGDRVVIRGQVTEVLGGLVLVATGPGLLDGVFAPVTALSVECPCLRLPELEGESC